MPLKATLSDKQRVLTLQIKRTPGGSHSAGSKRDAGPVRLRVRVVAGLRIARFI